MEAPEHLTSTTAVDTGNVGLPENIKAWFAPKEKSTILEREFVLKEHALQQGALKEVFNLCKNVDITKLVTKANGMKQGAITGRNSSTVDAQMRIALKLTVRGHQFNSNFYLHVMIVMYYPA
ncbi:unnamed protein product [Cylicostephanus goldi]|uniref:Uncharacterized protein n=1 Tax=Cylicostephanus goldi TaxID=71465 RepID=A0A3P7MV78_CYLGO|nr:unnamed protein product [Cylicostephanus goldi]